MNAESEERPFTGVEWAEQYLPIPADQHHHAHPPVDLVKAKHTQDLILGAIGGVLVAGAVGAMAVFAFLGVPL